MKEIKCLDVLTLSYVTMSPVGRGFQAQTFLLKTEIQGRGPCDHVYSPQAHATPSRVQDTCMAATVSNPFTPEYMGEFIHSYRLSPEKEHSQTMQLKCYSPKYERPKSHARQPRRAHCPDSSEGEEDCEQIPHSHQCNSGPSSVLELFRFRTGSSV